MPVDLLPRALILGRRVAAPTAATVAVAGEDRVLDAVGDERFHRVPRRAQAAAHAVDDLGAIHGHFHRLCGLGGVGGKRFGK